MAPRKPRTDDLYPSLPNRPYSYSPTILEATSVPSDIEALGVNLLGLDACAARTNGGFVIDISGACSALADGDVVSARMKAKGDNSTDNFVPSIIFYDTSLAYLGHTDGAYFRGSSYQDVSATSATLPTGTDTIFVGARVPVLTRDTFKEAAYPVNLKDHSPIWIEQDTGLLSGPFRSPWASWTHGAFGTDADWQVVSGNKAELGATAANLGFYYTTNGDLDWLDNVNIFADFTRAGVDISGDIAGFAFYVNPAGGGLGARSNHSKVEYRRVNSTQVSLVYVLKRQGFTDVTATIGTINLALGGVLRIGCTIQYPTLTVWTQPAGGGSQTTIGSTTITVDQRDSSHLIFGLTGQRGTDSGSHAQIDTFTVAPLGFVEPVGPNVTAKQPMLSIGESLSRYYPPSYNAMTLSLPLDETYGGTGYAAYTLGDMLYASSTTVLSKLTGNITTTRKFLRQTGGGAVSAAPAWDTILAADIPASALTRTNDTNVTLTLGGTPASALLAAASLTLGWSGQLGLSRGGTNADLSATGGAARVLKQLSSGAAITVATLTAAEIASGAALTKVDDTNVTLTLGGTPASALLVAASLTLGWTGTLAAARLNANVVQAITNDTNVTGSIAAQTLTLGWTGNLSVGRGGTGVATLAAGAIEYGAVAAAHVALVLGTTGYWLGAGASAPQYNAPAALTKTDDTNVTLTLGGSATTALLNAASLTLGWTGTLAAARLNANVVQAVTNDTNVTGSIATQTLTLGWTGTLAAARLNANVVQAITNDTNVTGSIAAQNLTLAWSGTLAAARLNANVVQAITNDTNVTGSISAQNLTLAWSGTLSVARGGLGVGSLTGHALLAANAGGTALAFISPSTAKKILASDGTDWASTAIDFTYIGSNIAYSQMPNIAGVWAVGGTLSITGGVTTVAGLTSTSSILTTSGVITLGSAVTVANQTAVLTINAGTNAGALDTTLTQVFQRGGTTYWTWAVGTGARPTLKLSGNNTEVSTASNTVLTINPYSFLDNVSLVTIGIAPGGLGELGVGTTEVAMLDIIGSIYATDANTVMTAVRIRPRWDSFGVGGSEVAMSLHIVPTYFAPDGTIPTAYGVYVDQAGVTATTKYDYYGTGTSRFNALVVAAGFGCNGAAAQTAYTSGGAVVANPTSAGYGFLTAAEMTAFKTLLNNIRTALVNNGIMS
jgi:hypothetical protein